MSKIPCITRLIREVRTHHAGHARSHLPWRRTRDPYRILVSEVMLQQTQVERVMPFYERFIRAYPNAEALAGAPLVEVLRLWQGLGYNRRGKLLRDAARTVAERHEGEFPRSAEALEELPGVGPYTARAIAAFAFNAPEVFIETNIRTVFTHFCFAEKKKVDDKELLPLIAEALEVSNMEPREFYAALMDYGAHLKRRGIRLNSRSAHYAKQSKFEGSRRQLRGQLLRFLLKNPCSVSALAKETGKTPSEVRAELERLRKEGVVGFRSMRFFVRE